mmetsp:Transcript_35520/g.87351  ORF Transcript_35520/g.87351 Transcript_35520/m.87351 type:complete len:227 (-) Transcript_35520:1976-2656(-)
MLSRWPRGSCGRGARWSMARTWTSRASRSSWRRKATGSKRKPLGTRGRPLSGSGRWRTLTRSSQPRRATGGWASRPLTSNSRPCRSPSARGGSEAVTSSTCARLARRLRFCRGRPLLTHRGTRRWCSSLPAALRSATPSRRTRMTPWLTSRVPSGQWKGSTGTQTGGRDGRRKPKTKLQVSRLRARTCGSTAPWLNPIMSLSSTSTSKIMTYSGSFPSHQKQQKRK